MKIQAPKTLITIFAVFVFSIAIIGQYAAPIRTLSIPPTHDSIIFDGIDNESSYSTAQTLTMFNSSGYNGIEDFSGYFKVCWDTRFLYFFANITDDINHSYPNYSEAFEFWGYDNIHIFLDLDTSGSLTEYTDKTILLAYNRDWNRVIWTGRADTADFFCNIMNKPSNDGWLMETAIPWTAVMPEGSVLEDFFSYKDNTIGFDVIFSDSDGNDPFTTARDIQSAWDSDWPDDFMDRTEDYAWMNRKVFGLVNLSGSPLPARTDVPPAPPPPPPYVTPGNPPETNLNSYILPIDTISIPPTVDSIIFDGIDNESSYCAAQSLTMFNSSGYNGNEDFSGYFKVCWDTRFLYFFANITDDINHSFPNYSEAFEVWGYDNIEIYIDLDTSGTAAEYTDKTIQLRFNRDWNRAKIPGRADTADYFCNLKNKPTNDGWLLEAAIPWTASMPVGSSEEDFLDFLNRTIGFDVIFSDSDGDDPFTTGRDVQFAWDADLPNDAADRTEDNAWNNRKVFGLVKLSGSPLPARTDTPPAPPPPPPYIEPIVFSKEFNTSEIQMYPNPSNGVLYFESLDEVKTIEFLNILGELVKKININDNHMAIDFTELKLKGILIATFKLNNGAILTRKIIIN